MHKPNELVKTYEEAVTLLQEGNQRYVNNQLVNKDTYTSDREILKDGQKPFAVIVTCSDSRVAPELFFDQRLGDLFVIRNAGNVVDQTALGSIEYAVEHLHSPLVVICGHSSCGAVTAAASGGELPVNIKSITDRMKDSVAKGGSVDDIIRENVHAMVKEVEKDEIVQEMGAKVLGAYYDIHTGEVFFI